MNELWRALREGDLTTIMAFFAIGFTISNLVRRLWYDATHPEAQPPKLVEVAPDGLNFDWSRRGIDWNPRHTVGYMPMSQHVIIAESELVERVGGMPTGTASGVELAAPPVTGSVSGTDWAKPGLDQTVGKLLRTCDYCGTMTFDSLRLSCAKCGAPLPPTTPQPKPVDRPKGAYWEPGVRW